MFIAAAGGGILVVGILAHDDHSNYSDHSNYGDHSNHSRYTKYGDSHLVNQIGSMKYKIERQENDIDEYSAQISQEYRSRMNKLKEAASYDALNVSADAVLYQLKVEMEQEIKNNIKEEKAQLKNINDIIKRINEIEMQATK